MNALPKYEGGTVVMVRDPFNPANDREVVPLPKPLTIRQYLEAQGIEEFTKPTYCLLNGAPVLRADWPKRVIAANDVCSFIALPQGGGGGGGGKNTLQMVAMVAVMVAAPYAATAIAPELAASVAAGTASLGQTLAFKAITGVISMAASALISAVLPAPKPASSALNFGGNTNTQAPSPTYSLQPQGNQARLGQPIPVIYGRHKVVPDLGATPYTEYVNNEQWLYQLHVIGQGEYAFETIKIADSATTAFEDITTEIIQPGGAITLFDPDVVTNEEVSGQELLCTADGGGPKGPFVANPVDTQAAYIGVDIVCPRGLYYTNTDGSFSSKTVNFTVQAREVDANGVYTGTGAWTTLGTETITDATNTPIRKSYKYAVTATRYEVQVERTDVKDVAARAGHELRWGQLRAYLNTTLDTSDVTWLALKARATDNLSSQASRQVNCVVTRKLPIWSSVTGWSTPTATQSIAWALADACRAKYGGKLEDARIDLAGLEALDAVWTARGDTFNGVFDSSMGLWDALGRIARCGRTKAYQQAGIVRFWRDAPQTLPVAMFGPRNIVRGSFSMEYILPSDDTANAVQVEYWSDRTWKKADTTGSWPHFTATDISAAALDNSFNSTTTDLSVLGLEKGGLFTIDGFVNAANNKTNNPDGDVFTVVSLTANKVVVSGGTLVDEAAGASVTVMSPGDKPAKVSMLGITNEPQGLREGDAMAAANTLRRKLVTFRTELDGMIPTYGDLVSVTHPLPRWAQGGDVTAWDAVNAVLTLSEPPVWTPGATHFIVLRGLDGAPGTTELMCEPGASGAADEVHLLDSIGTFTPYVDAAKERTHYSFGAGVAWGQKCILRAVRPRGNQVELTVVADHPAVHVN